MTTTPEQAVIQADRIAAAKLMRDVGRVTRRDAEAIERGEWDETKDVQAFAEHRLAHSQPASEGLREAVKPILDEINRLEREYGFDRPMHQGQCLMLPLGALIAFRAALHPLTEPQRLSKEGEANRTVLSADHPLARALRPSAETIAEIERIEQGRVTRAGA